MVNKLSVSSRMIIIILDVDVMISKHIDFTWPESGTKRYLITIFPWLRSSLAI
jgi:hypothetical protein